MVVLTPPPPRGFGADEATVAASRALARADDDARLQFSVERTGTRLSSGWLRHKTARWRATSEPAAVAGYVAMFARDGLPDPTARIAAPVLAITGEADAPPMRAEPTTRALAALCDALTVTPLADVGHYPMEELPPRTVALVEEFLGG